MFNYYIKKTDKIEVTLIGSVSCLGIFDVLKNIWSLKTSLSKEKFTSVHWCLLFCTWSVFAKQLFKLSDIILKPFGREEGLSSQKRTGGSFSFKICPYPISQTYCHFKKIHLLSWKINVNAFQVISFAFQNVLICFPMDKLWYLIHLSN